MRAIEEVDAGEPCVNCGHQPKREVEVFYCNLCGHPVSLPRVTATNEDNGHEAHFHPHCYNSLTNP